MSFEAEVIAHSASPYPDARPLITMRLRYPRFIHAEEITHRILNTSPECVETVLIPDGVMYDRNLSRNASSSRAIPVPRMIADIRRDPAEPIFWGKNQPGMQAAAELDPETMRLAKDIWRCNRESCLRDAEDLHRAGAHKQLVNRLVENHGHINVVVTATEWSNFFALRRHPDAQPEIRHLANLMWDAQRSSTPAILQPGQWHLPFFNPAKEVNLLPGQPQEGKRVSDGVWFISLAIRVSVARCARVSYLTHEGKTPTIEEDLALYERLAGSVPLHASPAEHQATPDTGRRIGRTGVWDNPKLHGNLVGWQQFRKTLPDECS